MSADWNLIRSSYEGGGGSLRRVAEQFGVSISTLLKRAARNSGSITCQLIPLSLLPGAPMWLNRLKMESTWNQIAPKWSLIPSAQHRWRNQMESPRPIGCMLIPRRVPQKWYQMGSTPQAWPVLIPFLKPMLACHG